MIRNRNGQWMDPRFAGRMKLNLQQFAEGEGGAGAAGEGGTGGEGGNDPAGTAGNGENGGEGVQGDDNTPDARDAEIAKLKAEMAKQKAALDAATSEAGRWRKELKSKMTQEQIDAAEKQEAAEKTAKELDDLRREVAKGKTVKTVMGKLGLDEETAGNLADHLYGAADIENALLEIQKAWQVKEKALRLEFGKIPGPGTGADSNSPEAIAVRRAQELGRARNAVNEQAQKALNAYMR